MCAAWRTLPSAPLPWDGTAGGSLKWKARSHHPRELHLITALHIGPAAGQRAGRRRNYRGLGFAAAPSSISGIRSSACRTPVALSGAAGRELSVHLETRDLSELLPALGERAAALPLKLTGSSAVFDGKVRGSLDRPQIQGRLQAGSFTYEGHAVRRV
jgi:hypothetical protein